MSVFVGEFLRKGIYFPFFKELSDQVVLLHYYRNKYFVEYRTRPDSKGADTLLRRFREGDQSCL